MPAFLLVSMAWFVVALSGAALGAILASFAATIVLRLPQGRSPWAGRSCCDGCGRDLRGWELVPILSALWTRRRCSTCGSAIDPLHMAMEVAGLVLGFAAFALFSPVPAAIWLVFAIQILCLGMLDARHFWLPDRLTAPLALSGLILGGFAGGPGLGDRLIGMAVGYISLAALRVGYRALRGRDGMGGGDPKMAAAILAWLGWSAFPFLLLGAALFGLLWVLARPHRARGDGPIGPIPFGTMLALAAFPAAWASPPPTRPPETCAFCGAADQTIRKYGTPTSCFESDSEIFCQSGMIKPDL